MAFEANAVPGAVSEKLLKSRLANLVQTLLVHFLGHRAFLHILDAGVMGGQHGVEQPLGIVGRLAHAERALTLDVVSSHLRAETQDQGVSRFQPVFAGDRMRKCRTFAERHQSAEGRIDAHADHIVQFFRHPVGHSVGRHFQDFVFAHAAVVLHEFAARLHFEIGISHGPAHDAYFVFVLDQAKVLDQVPGIHDLGLRRAQTSFDACRLGRGSSTPMRARSNPRLATRSKIQRTRFTGPGKSK